MACDHVHDFIARLRRGRPRTRPAAPSSSGGISAIRVLENVVRGRRAAGLGFSDRPSTFGAVLRSISFSTASSQSPLRAEIGLEAGSGDPAAPTPRPRPRRGTGGVVRGRVVAHPVGQGLDERRARPPPGAVERLLRGRVHAPGRRCRPPGCPGKP